jgi:anti-anti-sigma regulatory factor
LLREIGSQAHAGSAQTVVLSLEESNDLDSTAAEVIGEFCAALAKSGHRVILARVHDRVREVLAAAGQGELSQAATFSVADAVAAASRTSDKLAAGDN